MNRPERLKISPGLRSRASSADSEQLIEVVIELDGGIGNAPSVAALKEKFARIAAPVVDAIGDLGGEVIGEAWINQSLKARVPASGISELSSFDEVVLADVPHALTEE